ncbi:MAG TPA: VCBS repeat-containing protein [Chryseolinea sp.]
MKSHFLFSMQTASKKITPRARLLGSLVILLQSSILVGVVSCDNKPETLFRLRPASSTGVDFSNTITETDSFNILTHEYIYNGGGVAVADFNRDGLQDLFFTGNEVPNKLYLNKGNLKFKDVTEEAMVNIPGRWNSGAVVVDINNDGWPDLYVTATMKKDSSLRANMLFLNKGVKGETARFEEVAGQFGIADTGYSTMAAFFDYDRDGDLDLYVLTNEQLPGSPAAYRDKIDDGTSPNTDRLYRNNGNGTFANVSAEAGIIYEGFGLGLAVADLNADNWPDLYVSNDFLSNDIVYINNQDGTFSNRSTEIVNHQSHSSMGNDVADFDNDGLPDIVTLDMLPETNSRKKSTIHNKSYLTYINNEKYDYDHQYVRNMLHRNNGVSRGEAFSEIGQLAGIHQTEWSWSPLFADFDNDGMKDLIVTNGFPKDITDKDFSNYRADVQAYIDIKSLVDSIPVVRIPNYAFKNNGDLTFSDVSKHWGLDHPSFSNGAAHADLDNDGDLDYVTNNINEEAFIFENTLNRKGSEPPVHFIRLKMEGPSLNPQSIGTKIFIYYDSGTMQYAEQQVARGYLSSVEDIVHFGLGNSTTVDSIRIVWPDGNCYKIENAKADQTLSLKYGSMTGTPFHNEPSTYKTFLRNGSKETKLLFRHEEQDKIDFNLQRTLPHKFTQSGPAVSVGDVNNDGLDDVVLGGSSGHPITVFTQSTRGDFTRTDIDKGEQNIREEGGLLLFDADGDGDQDLYAVSGSIEHEPGSKFYQHRFFRNNGKGKFELDLDALPALTSSGSCVRAADIDGDNDLDLFVGGRIVTGAYPFPAESYLLENEKGRFKNATSKYCPELSKLGMVTDALFTDFNNDGKPDLTIVGEFMPVTFFRNGGTKFSMVTSSGIEHATGWWNSIVGGDFDNDGDFDYVVGNLGLNNGYQVTKDHPLKVFAKDFDNNGSVDAILACYIKESLEKSEEKKLYPVHFWDELNSQSPKFRQQFSRYKMYGRATMDDLLSQEDLQDALILQANHFESSYLENLGNETFRLSSLPRATQFSPINGMIADDINNDGNLDIVMVGNDYGNVVFVGRYDAFKGALLLGNGKGNFEVTSSTHSGFFVGGDAKGLVKLYRTSGEDVFIATQNRDSLKVFLKALPAGNTQGVFVPQPFDFWAEVFYGDGRKSKIEFQYGSGFLSQSSRKVRLPAGIKEMIIYDFSGKSRRVQPLEKS